MAAVNPNAQYFLHESGALNFAPLGGLTASPPVKKVWLVADIQQSPMTFATFLREAKEHGANQERLIELYMNNEMWKHDEPLAAEIGITDLAAAASTAQPLRYEVAHGIGQVALRFSKPVTLVPLTPKEAVDLAAKLLTNADAAVPPGRPN